MDENYPAGPEAAFTSHSHVEMVAHFMVAKVQTSKKSSVLEFTVLGH